MKEIIQQLDQEEVKDFFKNNPKKRFYRTGKDLVIWEYHPISKQRTSLCPLGKIAIFSDPKLTRGSFAKSSSEHDLMFYLTNNTKLNDFILTEGKEFFIEPIFNFKETSFNYIFSQVKNIKYLDHDTASKNSEALLIQQSSPLIKYGAFLIALEDLFYKINKGILGIPFDQQTINNLINSDCVKKTFS